MNTPKTYIQHYADTFDVPHLPDSTLPWSQRGQIRNTIVPTLLDWEPRVINGLHHLTKHLQDLCALAELQVHACLARTENGCLTFLPDQSPPTSPTFWRMYLSKATKNTSISTKAIATLIDRIGRSSTGKVPLKKTLILTLSKSKDGAWTISWERTQQRSEAS